MDREAFEKGMGAMLPGTPVPPGMESVMGAVAPDAASRAKAAALGAEAKARAAKLAGTKRREKARLKALEESGATGEAETQRGLVDAVEELESLDPLDVRDIAGRVPASAYPGMVDKALRLQGPTSRDMRGLFDKLGINLSVRLSKNDTANLLACLLTANENQLAALLEDRRVPLAVKTVCRRLLDDSKVGDTTLVERLWSKLFGQGPLDPASTDKFMGPVEQGLLPGQPVSREAYVVLREMIIK